MVARADWAIPPSDTYFRQILQNTPEGFEIDHLREALQHCPTYQVAVDGGAHIGTWSAHLAGVFEKVLSFEPAPDTYECLLQNTSMYPNVKCFQRALSEKDGWCLVKEDPTRVGNTGSRITEPIPEDTRRQDLKGLMIRTVALDTLELRELDFLKLDVEGHEYPALLGAEDTIARCLPTIVVECKSFHPPRHGGPARVVELLSQLGYRMVGGLRNDKVFVPK